MRWLCFLLAFLVLGLSVQPACAAFSLMEMETAAAKDDCCKEEQMPDDLSSSQKDCHGCNPFHSCSCCVASIVLPFSLQVEPTGLNAPFTGPSGRYQQSFLPEIAFDFWQPPRFL